MNHRSVTENMEVAAADVVRCVLQFLKESGLHASYEALAAESQVALNRYATRFWMRRGRRGASVLVVTQSHQVHTCAIFWRL